MNSTFTLNFLNGITFMFLIIPRWIGSFSSRSVSITKLIFSKTFKKNNIILLILLSIIVSVIAPFAQNANNSILQNIDGLSVWLDPASGIVTKYKSGYLSGYRVVRWNDQSGNDHDAKGPAKVGKCPFYRDSVEVLNGRPAVDYHNVPDMHMRLETGIDYNSTNYTIIFVKSNKGGGTYFSTYGFKFYRNTYKNKEILEYIDGSDVKCTYSPENAVITIRQEGGTASIYANGKIVGKSENVQRGDKSDSQLMLGKTKGSDGRYKGMFGEILVFNRALSQSEQYEIEQYLTTKFLNDETEPEDSVIEISVRPVLECVHHLGGDKYRAWWGYLNENPFKVTVPIGADNNFHYHGKGGQDLGQVTEFEPGRHRKVFSVGDFDGTNLVWHLEGRTATANGNAANPDCEPPLDEPFGKEGLVMWLDVTKGITTKHKSGYLSGDRVVHWKDQSGNGHDAKGPGKVNKCPFYRKNVDWFSGKPVVVYHNVPDMHMTAETGIDFNSNDFTFTFVKSNIRGGSYFSTRGLKFYRNTYKKKEILEYTNGSKLEIPYSPEHAVITISREGSVVSIFVNGTKAVETRDVDFGDNSDTQLMIGKTKGADGRYKGMVGDIMVYNRALTHDEREEVENHLLGKFGMTDKVVIYPSPEIDINKIIRSHARLYTGPKKIVFMNGTYKYGITITDGPLTVKYGPKQ